MQKITDTVFADTTMPGCNPGFVVTTAGVVMIDTPQVPTDAVRWRDEITKYGPVRYLINTEPHGDHFTGNCFFEGTVIAHEGVRAAIAAADVNAYKQRVLEASPDLAGLLEDFHYRIPEITFSKELTLYVGDHTFKLINMPGHTPFQAAVFIPEERVVFTSDNIFYKTQTFLQQAVPYEWLESLEKLNELEVDTMVPGHGETCDRSYIPEMRKVIQAWIDTIKKAMADGLTVEAAQEQIKGVDPYEEPAMADWLNKINVARLYQALQ